jgi:hypothetical protein
VDAYSEIQAALPRRPRWQLVGFAAGCAQRLLPMAASLGGPAMAEPTQAGVALAWNAAAGRTVQPELEQAISDLRQAMEAAHQDRLGLKLLAAWAMDLTVFALEAAATSTLPPWGAAQAAAAGAIDLLGQVDLALAHLPLQHRVIIQPDDGEEDPTGRSRPRRSKRNRPRSRCWTWGIGPTRRRSRRYGGSPRRKRRNSWRSCRSSRGAGRRTHSGAGRRTHPSTEQGTPG